MRYKIAVVTSVMVSVLLSAGATPARATAWVQMPGGLVLSDDGSKTFINAPVPAGNAAADLNACGCGSSAGVLAGEVSTEGISGWTMDISYRAPSDIPVPDSVVSQWKKLPLTDANTIKGLTTAYQRRE
jgi:hypothetical protein